MYNKHPTFVEPPRPPLLPRDRQYALRRPRGELFTSCIVLPDDHSGRDITVSTKRKLKALPLHCGLATSHPLASERVRHAVFVFYVERNGCVTWSDSIVLHMFKRFAKGIRVAVLIARLDVAVARKSAFVDALDVLSGHRRGLVGGLRVLSRHLGGLIRRNVDGLGGFLGIATTVDGRYLCRLLLGKC